VFTYDICIKLTYSFLANWSWWEAQDCVYGFAYYSLRCNIRRWQTAANRKKQLQVS